MCTVLLPPDVNPIAVNKYIYLLRYLVMRRQGRRCKQLLDNVKDRRGYWKLKEEALDCTLCRTHFGRGYQPVIIQTMEWMNLVLLLVVKLNFNFSRHNIITQMHCTHNCLYVGWKIFIQRWLINVKTFSEMRKENSFCVADTRSCNALWTSVRCVQ
jgi:hypothetical protein